VARHNIGVAIALPEPFQSQLQGWRELLGDPAAASIVPHVRLLPPTAESTDQLPGIREHLTAVAACGRPFEVHLRGAATFRPVSPVVFVPLVAGISDCELLERSVRSGPLGREPRFPYHPHVTVAHDLPEDALDRAYAALAPYEARFPVASFQLFEQDAADRWVVRQDYLLAG
jgi:2'-5' RNA ligase